MLTCDIITEDGWIYYFDPDELILKDTAIRVDISNVEALSDKYGLTLLSY